jgi:hypothetical protein
MATLPLSRAPLSPPLKKGSGRSQRETAINGTQRASGEQGVLDKEAIKQSLDEQMRLQNELLSYNRKIFLILSQTHVLKSASQRFVDFWYRQRREK